MQERLKQIKTLSADRKQENIKLIQKIKKKKPKNFDYLMLELHDDVFMKTDCLACANCCKTTSPIITEKDLERIAKFLKMKAFAFIEKYLEKDTDGLWMFQQTPCVFLDSDNYCLIYEVRPKACREYPHTDRKKNIQLLNLHLKNIEICPAVFDIFELLKENV